MHKPIRQIRATLPMAAAIASLGLMTACNSEPAAEEEPEATVVDYSTGETTTEAVDPGAIPVTLPQTPETDVMVEAEPGE